MTKKLVSLALSVCLVVPSAYAQQQPPTTRKPVTKAAEAKKAQPVAVAEPAAPPAPPPPPPFAPVRYSEGTPPTDYLANEPQKVFEWIQGQLNGVSGKPDQYSSSDERQQYEAVVRERMSSIGQLPVPSLCSKKYDGDAQAFEVKTLLNSIKDIMLKNPNPEAIKLRRMMAGRANMVRDTYQAQNAYGASVEVSKTSYDEYAISFPAGNEPPGVIFAGSTTSSIALPYRYTFNFLTMTVKMPPAVARDTEKQIVCLSVVSLDPPYIFKFNEREAPKRDMPFETVVNGFSLFGKLERFIVFNQTSGEVYAQVTR